MEIDHGQDGAAGSFSGDGGAQRPGFGLGEGAPIAVQVNAAQIVPPMAHHETIGIGQRHDHQRMAAAEGACRPAGAEQHIGEAGKGLRPGGFGRVLAGNDDDGAARLGRAVVIDSQWPAGDAVAGVGADQLAGLHLGFKPGQYIIAAFGRLGDQQAGAGGWQAHGGRVLISGDRDGLLIKTMGRCARLCRPRGITVAAVPIMQGDDGGGRRIAGHHQAIPGAGVDRLVFGRDGHMHMAIGIDAAGRCRRPFKTDVHPPSIASAQRRRGRGGGEPGRREGGIGGQCRQRCGKDSQQAGPSSNRYRYQHQPTPFIRTCRAAAHRVRGP